MHVLPRVAELHERFAEGLVVIGVHAGKYPAERRTSRIRSACARLGVHHPVVNDRQFRIWRSYAVEAWPTVVLVSPSGRVLLRQAGEFRMAEMAAEIERLLDGFERDGSLDRSLRDFGSDPSALPEPSGVLRFPGRLALDRTTLWIADTGNHRILEVALSGDPSDTSLELSGVVSRAIGGSVPGFSDGVEEARFREPQGLAVGDGVLYIADRGNHVVRAIDVASGRVSTIAGTGELGESRIADGPARSTPLRSPWDVALEDGALAVAMAGSHQLWRIGLAGGALSLLAGSGGEEIVDGPAHSALLAQPMGLASGGGGLAFCDAESSSVRTLGTLETGHVRTLVGTGLFDHGDRDGVGAKALLQHPEALAFVGERLVVCDTYNDKLKSIDPATLECVALPGDAGSGTAFSHPAGIAVAGERLLVADSEAHRIAVVDARSGAVSTLVLEEQGPGPA
jgi:hypothetical protein